LTQLQHPALSVWRELRPERAVPERLEILEERGQKTAVYRLLRVGREDSNIVAKRCRMSAALIERTIYEEILPRLPIPMIHYYGFVAEPDSEFGWLFLEDVSDDSYQPHIKEHQVAAARWLGIMNISASSIEAAAKLSNRGPNHYLNLLDTSCAEMQLDISNPALDLEGRKLLENILDYCQQLAANWGPIEHACEGMPQTLVHGDFISKNVAVRIGRDGFDILPFDWEKAGWGVPAEDISGVDIATYWRTVRDFWPQFDLDDFKRLARVGRIFRWIVFLDWIAPGFARDSVERPMRDLRHYADWLLADLREAPTWRDKSSVPTI
jgi:hypothetical protein